MLFCLGGMAFNMAVSRKVVPVNANRLRLPPGLISGHASLSPGDLEKAAVSQNEQSSQRRIHQKNRQAPWPGEAEFPAERLSAPREPEGPDGSDPKSSAGRYGIKAVGTQGS